MTFDKKALAPYPGPKIIDKGRFILPPAAKGAWPPWPPVF